MTTCQEIDPLHKNLIEVFVTTIAVCFDNIRVFEDVCETMGNLRAEFARGRTAGMADMLLSQLARRFIVVPTELEARIRLAEHEQLTEWSSRFVDAIKIDDIL